MSNPAVYDNRQRDGLASIQKFARVLCGIVTWAGPIIELKYRANPAILALLLACKEVCNLLPAAEAALDQGGMNDFPPEDVATLPGTDPTALPPAVYVP